MEDIIEQDGVEVAPFLVILFVYVLAIPIKAESTMLAAETTMASNNGHHVHHRHVYLLIALHRQPLFR